MNNALLRALAALQARRRPADDGVTAVEYGLLVALIAVVIIGGVTLFGGALNTMFTNLATTIGGVGTG